MDILSPAPLTMALGNAGIAAGTTTTLTIANAISYAIAGKAYSKGATSNIATPTTDAVTGSAFPALSANQGAVVLVGLDASGNLKAAQGPSQALDATGAFIVAPQFPAVPDGFCPVGYVVLKAGATLSGTFTFGSSNLSSVTGMTYSFTSLITLPARPQIA